MRPADSALSDMQRAVRDTVRLHWQLFLAQGVIMLILGVLAVVWPQISTLAVDIYVGWLFLLSGIVGILTMFLARDVQAFLWMLLTAALSLFVGVMLVWHPTEGAVSLTMVLTAFFIVEGVVQIVASLSYRDVFPEPMGMDAGERHRRFDPCRDHHCRLAEHRRLGVGSIRRRQFDHVGRRNHHCGARRTRGRKDIGERRPVGDDSFAVVRANLS